MATRSQMQHAGQPMMDVSKIDSSASNPASRLRGIEELAASIKATGHIYEPIVLVKAGQRYTIEDGHRRFAAALHLGMTEVPYRLDETKLRPALAQLVTGTQKEKLTPWETAQLVGALLKEKVKQVEIAEACGRSEAWVSKLKTIWEASKKTVKGDGRDGVKDLPYIANGYNKPVTGFDEFTNIDDLYAACQLILNPSKGKEDGSTGKNKGQDPGRDLAGSGGDAGDADPGNRQVDLVEHVDDARRIELEGLAARFAEMFRLPAVAAELLPGKKDELSLVLTFSSLKTVRKAIDAYRPIGEPAAH